MPIPSDSIADLVSEYLEAVKAGRHTTGKRKQKIPRAATVAMYTSVLRDVFLKWTIRVKLTDPSEITDKVLDRFREYLAAKRDKKGKPLSGTTIQSYARDVSSFLRWAHKRGATADVRMVVQDPGEPEFDLLTQGEVRKLIETAGPLRDKIIVRLLAETGCRLGELLALTVSDIHREDGFHYVAFVDREHSTRRLKTKDSARTAAIQRDLFKDLREYVNARPGSHEDDAFVFMSERRSRKNGYEPLSASGIQQMLKHLGEDAQIRPDKDGRSRVHAHAFRHLFATEYLRGDDKPGGVRGDPVTLAKILGHRSLAMIQRTYDKRNDRDIQRATLDHLDRLRKRAS
jgi:integrase/recombinase XerD